MSARGRSFCAGMIAGLLLAGGGLWSLAASMPPLPGHSQESVRDSVRVVLENERVRVREVTFAPGAQEARMHTHDLPHVGVILTKGELVFTERNGRTERVAFEAGGVGYRDANVTHSVANPGIAPMRVIEVELK